MDRMQQQKETAAMDKLRQLMPQLGDMVRALALSKNEWDIDKAVSMLRSFQVAHLDKVNALNKVRGWGGCVRVRSSLEVGVCPLLPPWLARAECVPVLHTRVCATAEA
jgi:hypothetical protein